MIPTDAEIVKRLEGVAGWLETTIEKRFLPVVKGMLLEARLEEHRKLCRFKENNYLACSRLETDCGRVEKLKRELAALAVEEHHGP